MGIRRCGGIREGESSPGRLVPGTLLQVDSLGHPVTAFEANAHHRKHHQETPFGGVIRWLKAETTFWGEV